jgi:hypothetical protein
MKVRYKTIFLAFIILFISCKNYQDKQKPMKIVASTLSFDSLLFKSCADKPTSDNPPEQRVIQDILRIMPQFVGKPLDTTILTIGNIDGVGSLDTILNRIFLIKDTIKVQSWWVRNCDTLWFYSYNNPYAHFNNSGNLWITFVLGINYGLPEIRIDYKDSTADQYGLPRGLSELNKIGYNIDEADYKRYLATFNGDLLEYGDPTFRSGIDIWYEPARRFIIYFSP